MDCTDDPGVPVVEADGADICTMDVRRLAGDDTHDILALLALVADLPTKCSRLRCMPCGSLA